MKRWVGPKVTMVLFLAAALAGACSQAAATPTPSASTGGGAASPQPTGTLAGGLGAGPSAASPIASAPSSNPPALLAHRCDMLDVTTIDSVTGLSVAAGRETEANPSSSGGCLWNEPSVPVGVQITAFPEKGFAAIFANAAIPTVSGLAFPAKGSTVKVGAETGASLYVDFGTFGMLIVTTSPTATLSMSVALANALK
jgi:hypothetical protein